MIHFSLNGRLKEQNRNLIVMAGDDSVDLPENYIWMTINQYKIL